MQKIKIDSFLFIIILTIIGFGISINYSASSALSLRLHDGLNFYLKKQIIFTILGLIVMLITAKIKINFFKKTLVVINGVTICLLLLTYIPMFQISSGGAERWINLFGLTFQPSEIAKITVILTLSSMIAKRRKEGTLNNIFDLRGLPMVIGYVGMYAVMILMQNHLSATGIIIMISMTLLLIGGLKKIYFLFMVVGAFFVVVVAVIIEPFRLERIKTLFDPFTDPMGDGYQIIQSWYALGSGDLFGLGLGMSRQKFTWLPENHTDFIIAIVGEEIGFFGVILVILLFLSFALRGLTLASKTNDDFGLFVLTGIVLLIFYQFLINLAVVSGLFPVTGMPLPFISYGGSSTVILYIGLGLIFNIISRDEVGVEMNKKEEIK